jgi:hypothetical protein
MSFLAWIVLGLTGEGILLDIKEACQPSHQSRPPPEATPLPRPRFL